MISSFHCDQNLLRVNPDLPGFGEFYMNTGKCQEQINSVKHTIRSLTGMMMPVDEGMTAIVDGASAIVEACRIFIAIENYANMHKTDEGIRFMYTNIEMQLPLLMDAFEKARDDFKAACA